MASKKETPGEMIAAARKASGMSLRQLGMALGGLSGPYLHDVENDRRRLAPVRWRSLTKALPSLSINRLAEATVATGKVEIDAAELTAPQRAHFVLLLIRQASGS